MEKLKAKAKTQGAAAMRLAELLGDLPIDRVARVSGVSRSTLRRGLHGQKRGPSYATLEAVEAACQKLKAK